jgi:hypothetical protein
VQEVFFNNRWSKKVVGGSTYSYSRFGGCPKYDLTKSSFHVGTKTTTMPTTGTATYSGYVVDSSLANNAVNFNVDYGKNHWFNINIKFTNGTITGLILQERHQEMEHLRFFLWYKCS